MISTMLQLKLIARKKLNAHGAKNTSGNTMNYKDRLGQPIKLGDTVLINDNIAVIGVVYRFTEHTIFVQCLDGQKHTGGPGHYTVINENLTALSIDTREKIVKKYDTLMQEGRDLTQKELSRINLKKACSYCIFVYNEAACTTGAAATAAAGMQFLLNAISNKPTYLIIVPNQTSSKSLETFYAARRLAEQKLVDLGFVQPGNFDVRYLLKKVDWPVDETGNPITYLELYKHEKAHPYYSSAHKKFKDHKERQKLYPVLVANSSPYKLHAIMGMINQKKHHFEQFFSPTEVNKVFNVQPDTIELVQLPDNPQSWPNYGLILC